LKFSQEKKYLLRQLTHVQRYLGSTSVADPGSGAF
jgi:hypothetical protein